MQAGNSWIRGFCGIPPETIAFKAGFGEYAQPVAISSSKSMIGHLMAASGGPEFIYTVFIQHDTIHPIINLEHPDPRCDLDYVPKVKRNKIVRAAPVEFVWFRWAKCHYRCQEVC
jgi:3-oxoacyl-(acyl-carrier-protein) synthase